MYGVEAENTKRFGSDVLEWELPVSVVEALLVDYACGKEGHNIRWCAKGDVTKHNGVRCRVMDWETGKPVLFMPPCEFKPIEG